MKKENPEDNKIRRKKASPSSKSSTRRPSSSNSDLTLPSERSKTDGSSDRRKTRTSSTNSKRSSTSSNPQTKTRAVSPSSKSSTRNRNSNKNSANTSENNRKNISKSKNSKTLKRKMRSRRKKKIIGGVIAFFIIASALVLGFVFASLKDVKPVNEALLDKLTHQTTTIKYANGETMSTAPSQYKKTPIPLSDMSPYLRKAIISIEDERFYSHNGVDYWGLGRSVVKTLIGKKQGGSTIPMQVSKILLTSSDQTRFWKHT